MTLHVLRKRALAIGVVGLLACVVGAALNRPQFFVSYLFAYVFWFGIASGCLGLLLIHHVVGGAWGDIIRPGLEAAALTLPWLGVLFLPLCFGLRTLYPWARPDVVAGNLLLQHKQVYLNVPFFIARAVLYFVIWSALAYRLETLSAHAAVTSDPEVADQPRQLSAVGLVVLFLTLTFAYIDWTMSLEPDWYSTVYSALVIIGSVLSALAFSVCLLRVFRPPVDPSAPPEPPKPLIDLGNMLLTFVMFWAYLALSQYLIIWSGNIPDEISWYLHRQQAGWFWIAMGLIVLQFILPFLVLLGRENKRRLMILARVAVLLLAIRVVETFWLVVPAFHPDHFSLHALDLVALVTVGGLWLFVFLGRLQTRSSPVGRYVPQEHA